MSKMIKIQMVIDHLSYKKGQIIELEDSLAITLLTNGKALKIHRENFAIKNKNRGKNNIKTTLTSSLDQQ